MKILFTRSIDNAHVEKLKSNGHDISVVDLLTINELSTAESDIIKHFEGFKNLIFTSKHAVRIFFNSLKKAGLELPKNIPIFSTSGETKNTIERFGYSPTLSAPAATPLAELMVAEADLSAGCHFIAGTLSLPFIPDILHKNGVQLTILTVYETIKDTPQYPHDLRSNLDAIVFFSLSAADAFLTHNTLSNNTVIFTLGSTTAEYVREKTWIQSIFVAEKPTIEAVIDKILNYEL